MYIKKWILLSALTLSLSLLSATAFASTDKVDPNTDGVGQETKVLKEKVNPNTDGVAQEPKVVLKEIDDTVWKTIEGRYYGSASAKSLIIADDRILSGGKIVSNTLTPVYTSINLSSTKGIEAFSESVGSIGLKQSLTTNETFLGVVKGGSSDPIPSTAFVKKGIVTQVLVGDNGNMYMFFPTEQDKFQLSNSTLSLAETEAYFVIFDGFMTGIVFDDGTQQMVKILSSYKDIIKAEKVYTVEEMLAALQENKEFLTKYENVNQNLDPAKPNVVLD